MERAGPHPQLQEVDLSFSLEESIDRYVEQLETEREPDGHWHPSSISGCPRQALYNFRGVPVTNPRDARSKRILRVGHLLHEFAQEAIEQDPEVDRFYPEVTISHPGLNIAGHADGLLQLKDGTWIVLEFKTINSMAFRYKDLPKAEHVVQASSYIESIREHGCLYKLRDGTIGNIAPLGDKLRSARIIYISKDDLRIEECHVTYTPAKQEELVQRIALLERHRVNDTYPDRLPLVMNKKTKEPEKDWPCRYCPWADLCWKEDA